MTKRIFAALVFATLQLGLIGCGGSKSSGTVNPYADFPYLGLGNGMTVASVAAAPNVVPLTVDGSTCTSSMDSPYFNEPCVSVKICQPGTTTCQTINDVLLDTGSYGLRVFKSVLSTSLATALTPISSGGSTLTECAQYGDGSSDWGPLAEADVYVGGEPSVEVPIELIDSTYSNSSNYCSNADTGPSTTQYQAILGVGVFAQDCGSECASDPSNGMYFACNGTSCSGATAPEAMQATNPVAMLPVDNNGVILELPQVAAGGDTSASGYLILGIGTQSNNVPPPGIVTFPVDPSTSEFQTYFNGQNYSAFIDSGSNAIYFPAPPQIPSCPDNPSFFCPSSSQNLVGTTLGSSGTPAYNVSFTIGNFDAFLANPSNYVSAQVGGDAGSGISGVFDWGLPFYLGRNVYEGIDGFSSSLGSGPYWAY